MENDKFTLGVEIKRLMQGAEIPLEKVRIKICPACPFKTPFCEFRMAVSLYNPGLGFVCKGMRAYISKSN